MKKTLAVFAMLGLLSGCAGGSGTTESTLQSADNQTEQSETSYWDTESEAVSEEPLFEAADLPFRNKAAYKVTEKQSWSNGSDYVYVKTYDEHDNVIVYETYNENGELTYKKETAYEYDGDGNIVKEYYSRDNYYATEYENGRKARWLYYENGELCTEYIYEYYPNGDFKCMWSSYNGGEPFTHRIYEYEYDEKGRQSLCREISNEGELKETFGYFYDDSGNLTEWVTTKNFDYYEDLDESRGVIRYRYTYSDSGKMLTSVKTAESLDGAVSSEFFTQYKYDEQDRIISQTEYSNGELNMIAEFTYEMM
ncbi:MAG: hypothetical protein ACI4J1_04885 [Ruminiclostridium sp.]